MLRSLSLSSLLLHATYGGSNDADCSEIITVTGFEFLNPYTCGVDFDCDANKADYYFSGLEYPDIGTYPDLVYPTYTNPLTGAFFSVEIDFVHATLGPLASLTFTNGSVSDPYTKQFIPGWDHYADVSFTEDCDNKKEWEIQYAALEGATNVYYYSSDGYAPLNIIATLDDCVGVGLDLGKAPTKQPTSNPISENCPNYDRTVYSNCNNDNNCNSCQSWGCGSCNSGYYKMGNLMRCQSCSEIYPNCAQCGDWNGCTTCDPGYSLQYDATCNDEICVQN